MAADEQGKAAGPSAEALGLAKKWMRDRLDWPGAEPEPDHIGIARVIDGALERQAAGHATALRAAEERAAALERERDAAQAKLAAVLDLADAEAWEAVRLAAHKGWGDEWVVASWLVEKARRAIALAHLAQRLRAEAGGTGAEAEGSTR